MSRAQRALALNADGTVNSCQNAAASGSIVTIFMNGLGQTQPAQTTGMLAEGPPIDIVPGATGSGVTSTTNLPGSISGVAQLQVQAAEEGFVEIFPEVEGQASRQPVVIWVADE